jgi:flagellar protein FliL
MADDNSTESKKGGVMKLVVIIVVALLVLGGGGGGAWFFLMSGNDADQAASDEPAVPVQQPAQYLQLAPAFVVNFPHQGRQRFMQADISVMARDAQALAAVSQHMPVVRHALNNLFSAQLLLVFENPAGIENLRQLATEEVNQVLEREIGRPGIEEVLFTSFVMQ